MGSKLLLFRVYGQCKTAVLCAEAEFAIHETGLIHLKNKKLLKRPACNLFVWDPVFKTAHQLLLLLFKHSANTPTPWP